MSTALQLDQRVVSRIVAVNRHIEAMAHERQGWGAETQDEVGETALSFVRGLAMLVVAEEVWIDGGTGFSFGGRLYGGIVFGMIARHRTTQVGDHTFEHDVIEWSFHS